MKWSENEKNEQPTSKKKSDARKKGYILQSKEITSAASFFVTLFLLKSILPFMKSQFTAIFRNFFSLAGTSENIYNSDINSVFMQSIIKIALILIPLFLVVCISVIFISALQTKFFLKFILGKENKESHGKFKIFHFPDVFLGTASFFKIFALFVIFFTVINKNIAKFFLLMDTGLYEAVVFTGEVISDIINMAAAVFVFLTVADYIYQRYRYIKSLRMTKQEVKDEQKLTEGDPAIKGRIKGRQKEISNGKSL